MSTNQPTVWYHSNRYSAQSACEHCKGIVRHERWCITIDPLVHYAYQVVADPSKLTVGDALILHSLGAAWQAEPCKGNCNMSKQERFKPKP